MKESIMASSISLVLGGASSGKSRFAEQQTLKTGLSPVYLATASAGDAEMRARIDIHKNRRGNEWTLIEEPLELAQSLLDASTRERVILVDCLTLWLSNLMLAGRVIETECALLLDTLAQLQGKVIFVSNETGMGIVPENAAARAFRDYQGKLNQNLAKAADNVFFIAAGLPMILKQENTRC